MLRDRGVRRLVFRRLHGDTRPFDILRDLPVARMFKGNPVMDVHGMEVMRWDFDLSECRSLNLFADGTLGTSYLLTETPFTFLLLASVLAVAGMSLWALLTGRRPAPGRTAGRSWRWWHRQARPAPRPACRRCGGAGRCGSRPEPGWP